jgi:hypothetical protein
LFLFFSFLFLVLYSTARRSGACPSGRRQG